MDTIGGRNFNFWTVRQVKEYVNRNQSDSTAKKVVELISGLLLAACLHKSTNIEYCIGLPLKEVNPHARPEDGFSITELLSDSSLVDDTDIDIALANKDSLNTSLNLVQVARVPALPNRSNAEDILIAILRKKCRVQKDDKLNLVINIQERLNLDIDKIRGVLNELSVPFANILIVGKVNENKDLFQLVEIWPEVIESQIFSINNLWIGL